MSFLDRLFRKKPATDDATAADLARSRQMAGHETGQTADEQSAIRGRMEAEMDAQRERRGQPPKADA